MHKLLKEKRIKEQKYILQTTYRAEDPWLFSNIMQAGGDCAAWCITGNNRQVPRRGTSLIRNMYVFAAICRKFVFDAHVSAQHDTPSGELSALAWRYVLLRVFDTSGL